MINFFHLKYILKEKNHDEVLVHELNSLKGFVVTTVERKFDIYSSVAVAPVVTLNLPVNHLASGLLERDHPHQRKPASV